MINQENFEQLIKKLDKQFRFEIVKEPEKMPSISSTKYNEVITRLRKYFIGELKSFVFESKTAQENEK